MMGLFDKLSGNGGAQQRQVTPDMMRAEIGTIQQNPAAYLSQRGFSIPDGMTDPRQITVHLLQSGQIGSGRLQQIMQMLVGK